MSCVIVCVVCVCKWFVCVCVCVSVCVCVCLCACVSVCLSIYEHQGVGVMDRPITDSNSIPGDSHLTLIKMREVKRNHTHSPILPRERKRGGGRE